MSRPADRLRAPVNRTPRRIRTVALHLHRAVLVLVVACLAAGGLALLPAPAHAAAGDPCAAPVVNAVACENTRQGTTEWEVSLDTSIEGFATDISTNVGGQVDFKVRTDSTQYTIDIYRLGWYGGAGGRFVTSLAPTAPLPQAQPECHRDAASGMVDCGNWGISASWAVPADAVSGVYVATLRRQDRQAANQITFVVRNDASRSDIVFQTSDTTWAAYNGWGGANLYSGDGPGGVGRAYKVSYNRPLDVNSTTARLTYAEYPMIRFLESNGYDLSYQAGVDTDRFGHLLTNHDAFLSVGHDEYWSGAQRANVTAARDAGVDLAFFSGNEMWWRVRWEPSIDGSGQAYRSLVSYKESLDGARTDPSGQWTGTFRDPRFSPEGVEPENALIGQQFKVNGEYGRRRDAISVPAEFSAARLWRNTAVAGLGAGQTYTFGDGTLGYEWDSDFDNGFRPAGLAKLSLTTVTMAEPDVLQDDYGVSYAPGEATHSLTLYRAASGALVFGAGTVQWSWGLDDMHDGGLQVQSTAMQQATVNLFADMGIQPGTLRSGLVPAAASTDTTPPTVSITSSRDPGAEVASPVTITGTATDTGGIVAGVEVSVDGGTTWHPAVGRSTWSYTYTPTTSGPLQVRVRAVDDSAGLSTPVGFDSAIAARQCPCTIWPASAGPTRAPVRDAAALELGTRFQASVSGYATGVRFYKGAGDTGTHTGSLWTADGRRLGTGTFTGETAEGWQTLTLADPVVLDAGTPYVVSYYSPTGAYVADAGQFGSRAVVNEPLQALRSGDGGPNGIYRSGSSGFPTDTWGATNYWVDVVFSTGTPPDNRAPMATIGGPLPDSTSVARTATPTVVFDEPVRPESVAMTVTGPGGTPVAGTLGYDAVSRTATFTPAAQLAEGTLFTASLTAAVDIAGNALVGPLSWSFTTMGAPAAPGVCPCSIWNDTAVPAVVGVEEAAALELGMRFSAAGDGTVTGVRFYKGPRNTGVHTGTLWSATGEQLARATATAETSSGWQQIHFDRPVSVTAGVTYVVSYHTDAGYFSYTYAGLADGVTTGPLTALPGGTSGGNGVYRYGASAFPDQPGNANYWVDVVYLPAADTVAPSVTATAPGSGDTDVAPTTTVRAVLSEPVSSASAHLVVREGSTAVAGTTTYDAVTRTVTFTPDAALRAGAAYTAELSGATDVAGNVLAAPHRWTFTTAAAGSCPCTVFGDLVPGTAASDDPGAVELGMRFHTASNGFVTGVRFYKGAGNTGTHTGSLWSTSGERLATGTFVDETAQGWQQLMFPSPVAVTAGSTYVVSYHAPSGRYAADASYFADTGAGTAPLTAPASTSGAANGLYAYGGASTFPQNSWQSTNYWVDAVFTTAPSADVTGPAVSSTSPGQSFTDVDAGTVIRFDFDEPVTPGTAVVQVTAGGTSVAGSLAAAGDRAVVFTPTSKLPAGTSVTAVLTDARDAAGNPMTSSYSLSFRTVGSASGSCPCTVFGNLVPGTAASDDPDAVELGMRFRTAENGFVTGVRFYKGAGNTGTHTGSLWSTTGQRLATGTFVDETAQGWQQLVFASPVAVTAGTTYVVSYHAPVGRYAADPSFFDGKGAGAPPLEALASTSGAGNGLYSYGGSSTFPQNSWQSANYWVDAVFATTPTAATTATPPADTVAPSVVATTPTADAAGVAADAPVTVTFSEPVLASAVTLTVTGPSGPVPVVVTLDAAGTTATARPQSALAGGVTYTAGARATDAAGNAMPAETTWSFSTADTTAPSVVSMTPAAGSTGVAISTPVTATFTEPVRADLVRATLTSGGTPLVATVATADRTVTVRSDTALAGGTTYTVTLNGITDLAGNGLAAPHAWSFTTADSSPPTVASVSPAADATGVATSAPVTVTFSEPILATSGQVVLQAGTTTVAGTVLSSGDRAVTLTPGAALGTASGYTVTVSGVTDLAGNVLAAPYTWSFTTTGPPLPSCPCSLFGSSDSPPRAAVSTTAASERGMKFRSTTAGQVTGIRFYKAFGGTGRHTGSLWTTSGRRLASVAFTNETASGWQTATLSAPVAITANTVYVVSYTAPSGRWAQTANYFTAEKTTGRLQGLANGASANGVSGTAGAYPASSGAGANFWVDVVVTAAPATDVAVGTTTTAQSLAAPVAGASAPSATSAPSGPSARTDTVTPVATCPCSFSAATALPGAPGPAEEKAAERGLRFRATAAGWLTAVRWYAPAATDAGRVGSVWSGEQRLATVGIAPATAAGWQVAALDRPVPVSAGVEYVVSYTAPAGGRYPEAAAPTGTRVAGPLTATEENGAVSGDPGTAPATAVPGRDFGVDVVVVTTAPADPDRDPTAPTITGTGFGADGSGPTAVFSAAVSGVAMLLVGPDGRSVPAVLTYDAVTLTARLTPDAALRRGSLYRVTVQGAKDDAGHVITPLTWTFTAGG
jgi:methionine-rich copper-binding protein CopC